MWRIVTPKTRKQFYTTLSTDAYDPRATDLSSMSSVSWYSQVMRGPGSRMQSYKQYDTMDADIDIARSLDIIAEEISTRDEKTGLPFEIEWQKEDNQDIADSTIVTVRAALRQWSTLQDFQKRIFNIARLMIKYGDCFFRKSSDTKRWQFVDPSLVVGIEIDENQNIVNYHIRRPSSQGQNAYGAVKNEFLDIVPASAVIHFTMSDDMGDSAPFGQSVLRPIHRVYRQLSMLEDSMIIYRIVRAPERRVFYIDVGNMNQHQVKRYLEQVKNEMRQKKVPGTGANGMKDSVDGQYDPQCLTLDTEIPLLDGRTLSLSQLITEHEDGKKNWTYSCHPITGEIKPGEIVWAGVTRKNAELVKVTLDNGKVITCTPDHMIPVLGHGFVQAADLVAGQSLISHVTENKRVFDHSLGKMILLEGDDGSSNNQTNSVLMSKVEFLNERQDTGCITIGDANHDWHTFPTSAGVFVKNSLQDDIFMAVTANGRGSRVETLPGGTEDFGTNLLKQFQDKIFRGLRIPTSYMGSGDAAGAQTNDGKVGIAYIEELRFANFVSRLQQRLNSIFDDEFKIYLKVCGLNIDDEIFSIRLPDPANFALYRQSALDADLINSFSNIQEVKYLSRRFALKRYLGLSDDEIQMNEVMLKEERNIVDNPDVPMMQQLYDPAVLDNRDAIKVEVAGAAPEDTGGFESDMGSEFEEPTGGALEDTGVEDTPPADNEPETPTEPGVEPPKPAQ